MIAVAGWRTFRRESSGKAMLVWAAQLALNFVWSPVMFTMHQIGAALVILIGLFVAIVTYISLELSHDRLAAALFVPYAAWVAFAGVLNAAIWRLN
jgi:tryptophan-rich sensory protein